MTTTNWRIYIGETMTKEVSSIHEAEAFVDKVAGIIYVTSETWDDESQTVYIEHGREEDDEAYEYVA